VGEEREGRGEGGGGGGGGGGYTQVERACVNVRRNKIEKVCANFYRRVP